MVIPSWSLDRVAYPVKYYLASLDNLRYVGRPRDGGSEGSSEDASEEEYTRDVVALGALIKELFASVRLFDISFSDELILSLLNFSVLINTFMS